MRRQRREDGGTLLQGRDQDQDQGQGRDPVPVLDQGLEDERDTGTAATGTIGDGAVDVRIGETVLTIVVTIVATKDTAREVPGTTVSSGFQSLRAQSSTTLTLDLEKPRRWR